MLYLILTGSVHNSILKCKLESGLCTRLKVYQIVNYNCLLKWHNRKYKFRQKKMCVALRARFEIL